MHNSKRVSIVKKPRVKRDQSVYIRLEEYKRIKELQYLLLNQTGFNHTISDIIKLGNDRLEDSFT